MVICLEQGADLHVAQLMPLPLTVSYSSKIQIGFTFLVPAHLGSPGRRAVKRVCVCVYWLSQVVPDRGPLNGCVCVFLLLIKIMLSAPQIQALHLMIVHIIKCLCVCSYLAVSMCGR